MGGEELETVPEKFLRSFVVRESRKMVLAPEG